MVTPGDRPEPPVGTFDYADRVAVMRLVYGKLRALEKQQSCADCEGDGAKPCRAEDGSVVWRCAPCQARRNPVLPPPNTRIPGQDDPDWGSYV